MLFSKAATVSVVAALASVSTAFSASANNNVAVYWGQNSAGGETTQQRLSYYCEAQQADIILLSFLDVFNATGNLPEINFASACGWPYFPDSELLQCTTIAADIKTCQDKGKKVLLSLGGGSGSYGFTSDAQAVEFADELWNLFGGGESDTRPFGDSVVDGFDLDIEGGGSIGYTSLVDELRVKYATDNSKTYYVSAAPQCPIPDAYLGDVIQNAELDFVFVQFYNNPCGVSHYETNNFVEPLNFDGWNTVISGSSKSKNAKIYLGVPASATAANAGSYVPASEVISIATALQQQYSSFGGVMMWDASQAWANDDFAGVVKHGIDPAVIISTAATSSTVPPSTVPPSTVPTSTLPTSTPPTSTLPTSTLPTSTPPTSTLPTSTPPTSTLPTSTPPTSTPPTSTLPTSTPPTSTPPTSTPPTSTPPTGSATSTPPTSTPPTVTPPTSTPPTGSATSTPPTSTPPTSTPPTVTPPTSTPPTGSATGSATGSTLSTVVTSAAGSAPTGSVVSASLPITRSQTGVQLIATSGTVVSVLPTSSVTADPPAAPTDPASGGASKVTTSGGADPTSTVTASADPAGGAAPTTTPTGQSNVNTNPSTTENDAPAGVCRRH
ncbi:endochitinase [Trichomonascus vanleenenianus]|uniref:endochitinase n=1 Tax=Trichomonascus vanleenenianus TaxID=2268995 RepID=UPI003EC9D4E2